MGDTPPTSIVSMFFDRVEERGEHPFLWHKEGGKYRPTSWRETAAEVSTMARGLHALGVKDGERVVIVSENRPEWMISDLAIMAAGGITVPAYTTNTVDDHRHIVQNSEAIGIIVSSAKLAEKILPAAHSSNSTKFVIVIDPFELQQSLSVDVLSWKAAGSRGQHESLNVLDEVAKLKRTDTACIIYTSGTGGTPKGVMLSHGSMLHNCKGARYVLDGLNINREVFLSFLPLSHSYEHTGGLVLPIYLGAEIYYAEGVETLGANMVESRPTIMMSVPRLYESMHTRIMRGIQQAGGLKEKLFMKAVEIGTKRYHDPKSLTLGERLLDKLLDRLVRSKIKGRFGGRLKTMISGGGPLNPEIGIFFHALGLTILQGYGQTESGPVISATMPNNIQMHTVGPPILDTEVKIADDGEILCRGELLMNGYWNNDEATKHTIIDGWLHTGDIGVIHEDGCIEITDRKKDIIVNSGGDNIAPQRVEGFLTLQNEIAQAMVYGDKHPNLVGLIVPDADWLEPWAKENGKTAELAGLVEDEDLRKVIADAVARVNEELSNVEKVRKFIIALEPFTVDNEQMTPTMKVRRHKLREIYGEALENLY